jgi:hypothetical protein
LVRALLSAVVLAWTPCAIAEKITCVSCHEKEEGQHARSVHHSLGCQECHGGPRTYDLSPEQLRQYLSEVGAAGKSESPFDHGASFRGIIPREDIPALCGDCHADIERMNIHGIRTDQLARYWTSGHGKTLRQKGDTRVAVCVDCHGTHDILNGRELQSKTHPFNIPDTCGSCHTDEALMAEYNLSTLVVDEYRRSVHGELLFVQKDTGAPTCSTCHGNHSAAPPGFADVGAVCGHCHQHAAKFFTESIHAGVEGHMGCVQCHGGGQDSHFHLIERITKPSGVLIQRYAHLLASEPSPTPVQVAEAINPTPKIIMTKALPTCMDCHDPIDEDESLPKLFGLIDAIAEAERRYVETANRLDALSRGVLLVENQRFIFQDAKTHLIELAPLQHTLDNERVAAKVIELNEVCDVVNQQLDDLEKGLRIRQLALFPIWGFALLFSVLLYWRFKQLKVMYVKPPPE